MKRFFGILAAVLLLAAFAGAQTTSLTTLQDSASQKPIYFTLAVADENGQAGQIIVDNRVNGSGPAGNLSISTPEFTGSAHGAYVGFGANPDGSHAPFDGTATYSGTGYNPDGTPFSVVGTFNYHATFSTICQGRGCPTYGWHYVIKAGSTVTVQ